MFIYIGRNRIRGEQLCDKNDILNYFYLSSEVHGKKFILSFPKHHRLIIF